jgi:hypothetical protein
LVFGISQIYKYSSPVACSGMPCEDKAEKSVKCGNYLGRKFKE